MNSKKLVIFSSLKMALATFLSRILGLIREQVMALYFGASGLTDAFLVAYRIPNLMRDLFAEGAFSSAFVPTFVQAKTKSLEEARSLLWELFIILSLVTSAIVFLMMVFTPELIKLFAPSFVADPEKFQLTINLTRLMAPFLTFVSLAALFMGALNSLKVFFVPSVAPAFYNLFCILSMLLFSGTFLNKGYSPIYSLGVGAFVGGLMQALIQVPFLVKYNLKPMWPKKIGSLLAIKVMKLLGPGLVGFAATQINLLVTTILATSAGVGATSWLNYAFRLFQLPVGMISVSIGNSNLVHFSTAWKNNDRSQAISFLQASYNLSWVIVLPAVTAFLVFSDQMIHLIFERGKFDHSSTIETAKALRWYALGLPFYSLYKIFVPTFYTIDRQKIPVISSLISIGLNIIFCWSLVPHYGFEILALGTSLSMVFNSLFLGWFLYSDLKLKLNFFFSLAMLRSLMASVVTLVLLKYFWEVDIFDQSLMKKIILLAFGFSSQVIVYLIVLLLLGEREILHKIRALWLKIIVKK